MSDFLTNLVARSLGTAEVIRPRVESLFEPPRLGVEPPLEPSFASERGDRKPFEESDRETFREVGSAFEPTLELQSEVSELRLPRVQSDEVSTKLKPSLQTMTTGLTRGSAAAASVRPDRPRPRSVPPVFDTPTRQSDLESRAFARPLSPQPFSRSEQRAPDAGFSTMDTVGPVREREENSVHPPGSRGQQHPAMVPRVHPSLSEPDPVTAKQPVTPFVAVPIVRHSPPLDHSSPDATQVQAPEVARRSERVRRIALARRPDSEPTIQVTIGRVEVRAVPPEVSPRKERAVSPVMGLEEYLRRQAKRGDR